jgi:hypothetical protein
MQRLTLIPAILLILATLTIIIVIPLQKRANKQERLNNSVYRLIELSRHNFLPIDCRYQNNALLSDNKMLHSPRKILSSEERKLCKIRQKNTEAAIVEKYAILLTPNGCFKKFQEKIEEGFSSEAISKACEKAIERLKESHGNGDKI